MAERLLAGHRLIVHRGLARAGLLHREVKIRGAVCILRQVLRVDIGEHALDVHVAVEEDARVRRVVKALVRGNKLRIAQLGDVLRFAAARKPVAGVGIQQPVRPLADDALDIGIGALHLAEDDTVVVRLRLLVVELVVPALLHEDLGLFVDVRAEHAVEIHAHEVEQILLAAAGDREDGLVAVGHGVEEGLHRPLQQGHERLLDGKALRAVEHAVLQDVEHTGVVLRQGLEADAEGLVLVVAVEVQELRSALLVPHGVQRRRLGGDVLLFFQLEAAADIAGLSVGKLHIFSDHGSLADIKVIC